MRPKITNNRGLMDDMGISPIISTIIVTASLLIILLVAFFFATNMLEIQMERSEFEQAKVAMLLLDRTIVDVSLRYGAASSVQFNQRSGGIGVYEGEPLTIMIIDESGTTIWRNTATPYIIKYRGGSLTPAAQMNLTNPGGLILRDPSKPLGYVRVEVRDGAWIVLDYNRVRVMENKFLKAIDVYMIRLTPGRFGGSGAVTVRVQNKGVNLLFSGFLSGDITLWLRVGSEPPAIEVFSLGGDMYNVRVMATIIEISIV